MEISQASPIVIQSDDDDDDDDVVLVKEEKAQSSATGKDEEDVIFISEEPAQHPRGSEYRNRKESKGKGRSSDTSSSDEDDTFALPQLVGCSSEISSISVVDDILRPLDLSQGTPQPSSIRAASSSVNGSALKPFLGPLTNLPLEVNPGLSVDKLDGKMHVELDLGSGTNGDVVDSLLPGTSAKPQRFTPLKLTDPPDPSTSQTLNTPICKVDLGKDCFELQCSDLSGSSGAAHLSTTVQDSDKKTTQTTAVGSVDLFSNRNDILNFPSSNDGLGGSHKATDNTLVSAGGNLGEAQSLLRNSVCDQTYTLLTPSTNAAALPTSSVPSLSSGFNNAVGCLKSGSSTTTKVKPVAHYQSTNPMPGPSKDNTSKPFLKDKTPPVSLDFDQLSNEDVINLFDFLFPDDKPQTSNGVGNSSTSQIASNAGIASNQSSTSNLTTTRGPVNEAKSSEKSDSFVGAISANLPAGSSNIHVPKVSKTSGYVSDSISQTTSGGSIAASLASIPAPSAGSTLLQQTEHKIHQSSVLVSSQQILSASNNSSSPFCCMCVTSKLLAGTIKSTSSGHPSTGDQQKYAATATNHNLAYASRCFRPLKCCVPITHFRRRARTIGKRLYEMSASASDSDEEVDNASNASIQNDPSSPSLKRIKTSHNNPVLKVGAVRDFPSGGSSRLPTVGATVHSSPFVSRLSEIANSGSSTSDSDDGVQEVDADGIALDESAKKKKRSELFTSLKSSKFKLMNAVKHRKSRYYDKYLHRKSSGSSHHSKSLSLGLASTGSQPTKHPPLPSYLKSPKARKYSILYRKMRKHRQDKHRHSSDPKTTQSGSMVVRRVKLPTESASEASSGSKRMLVMKLHPDGSDSGSAVTHQGLSSSATSAAAAASSSSSPPPSSSTSSSQPPSQLSYDKGLKKAFIKRQSSMVALSSNKGKQPQVGFHRSASETAMKEGKVEENSVQMWCVTCIKPYPSSKLSKCGSGHGVCASCLEAQVKAILTGEVKQKNIKCPATKCIKILTFDELKQTLPSFVVDILEEKLDKEYLSYITKWMFTDEQLKTRSEFATSDTRTPPCPALNMRKYEEIYTQESRDPTEDLPTFWTPMERGAPVMVYEVVPDTDEYTALAIQFHETLPFGQYDIVRIIRVQNPILWKYFALKRSEMVQENEGMDVTEKQLYHGTHQSTLEAIARKGFDWRLSGKHGTVFGCGSYFAATARYSHGYTDRGGNSISVKNGSYSSGLINPPSLRPMYPVGTLVPSPILSRIAPRTASFALINQQNPSPFLSSLPLPSQPASVPLVTAMESRNQPPPAHFHQPPPPPAHGQMSSLQMPAHNQTSCCPSTCMKNAPNPGLGPVSGSSGSANPAPSLATFSLLAAPIFISPYPATSNQTSSQPQNFGAGSSYNSKSNSSNNSSSSLANLTPIQPKRSYILPARMTASGSGAQNPSSSSSSSQSSSSSSSSSTVVKDQKETKPTASSSRQPASKISRSRERGTSDLGSAFARDSNSQTHFMFVARVLVGRYTGGKSGLKRPPPLDENNPFGKSYDSCVDHIFSPQVFVIFDSNQAYPEYVIEYSWNKEQS